MQLNRCPYCSAAEVRKTLSVREMMYGTREPFEYRECAGCGSLWIGDELTDHKIASLYPPDYYSFSFARPGPLRRLLLGQRYRAELGRGNLLGRVLARRWPDPQMRILGRIGATAASRIADVGCGNGDWLGRLRLAGFRNLLGIDPFVREGFVRPDGIEVRKAFLAEVAGPFDLIMFNHSLEHVEDPVAELQAARDRLASGGRILVRVPVTSSEAYEEYGADWFQIDAPRHFAIPSREGMQRAAGRAGLALVEEHQDSTLDQFRISEMYRQDIPLVEVLKRPLDPQALAGFEARAQAARAAGRGDQAAFVLEPL